MFAVFVSNSSCFARSKIRAFNSMDPSPTDNPLLTPPTRSLPHPRHTPHHPLKLCSCIQRVITVLLFLLGKYSQFHNAHLGNMHMVHFAYLANMTVSFCILGECAKSIRRISSCSILVEDKQAVSFRQKRTVSFLVFIIYAPVVHSVHSAYVTNSSNKIQAVP
jgi:hypothetical protein